MSRSSNKKLSTSSKKADESDINIRQAMLSDREAIWEFMKIAYEEEQPGAVQYKIPFMWNWQFLDNPFVDEIDDRLPIWIAIKGDEIVGQMCAMPMRITIGNKIYDGAWGCDFIVLKKYRGLGIGGKLNKAMCDHFEVVVHVTQARGTEKIWERYGHIAISPLASIMWKLIKLNGDFVLRYMNSKTKTRPTLNRLWHTMYRYFFLQHIIAFCANLCAMFLNAKSWLVKKNEEVEITEVKEFDDEFTVFIESASAGYNSLVKRNSKFLKWKYLNNPIVPYHIFVLKKRNRIKGYIVLRMPHRVELNTGIIADIFTERYDVESMEALISHAVKFFGKSVNLIQVLVSSVHIKNTFKNYGFITRKNYESHFVCPDPVLKGKLKNHAKDWFITFADHDQEQVRPLP